MRAVVYDRYGPPEVLRLVDLPRPEPAHGQVLVRVRATSVNLSDYETLRGKPLYARIGGLRRPARSVLGSDIAGEVEAVGPGVQNLRPGDRVYGDNLMLKGGFAEFAVAPERVLTPIPDGLTFAQAASIPQAGVIAAIGTARVERGMRVLINGAGGGSGMFAIQLAKEAGAHVTGVDNAAKGEFMRSLGADVVIDYRTQDYTRSGRYDVVLDMVAHRSILARSRAVARGGSYQCVGGSVPAVLGAVIWGGLLGAVTHRSIGMAMATGGPDEFRPVADRVLSGALTVHIDRTVSLPEVPEALRYSGEGRALGKVVVTP
ncbi:NAD(P)-dependent alcohol dehydrogenase [Ruania alkalisoli]|uniref:NAD(P)-dependent alcohol dehydrogenase n=1 Tax=Ruania alkalisoli TaxID=2779775 RepID=A0A7M1SQP6_9MICO|nr:NAD(P)-dependent alcohol dehydrogenase [Ruania alkalisoli]QOR69314.1 NAD(P)-dependent alcohol dehydrogenase [Ruania alkalisoli]